MIIFEAGNLDAYYVCTPWRGVLGGEPHIFGLRGQGRAIDFDEAAGPPGTAGEWAKAGPDPDC